MWISCHFIMCHFQINLIHKSPLDFKSIKLIATLAAILFFLSYQRHSRHLPKNPLTPYQNLSSRLGCMTFKETYKHITLRVVG